MEVSRRYAGSLLAWPQLPQLNFREQSYVQSAVGFPGLVIDPAGKRAYVDRRIAERELDQLALAFLENDISYAALTSDDAVGLHEISRQGEHLPGVLALKGQLMGPISLAAQLTDEQQRPLLYDDTLFEALVQHLRLRIAWQEAYLAEFADATIMCLNEPFLEIVDQPFLPLGWDEVRQRLDEVLSGVAGCKGLFAGGAIDWAQVLQTSVELIIADVYEHSRSLVMAAQPLQTFLAQDGILGLGIVPADGDELRHVTADHLLLRCTALLDSLESAGASTDVVLRQAVISVNGSLGHIDTASSERALQLVNEVSTLLRARYRLG